MKARLILLVFALLTMPAHADELKIASPSECSSHIGSGGNLVGDVSYKGKCQGNASPPVLDRGEYVQFVVDGTSDDSVDRSELAAVRPRLLADHTYYITASVNIPKDSQVTEKFFYLMQLWQGSKFPPLAGIRINRGSSHEATLMTRDKNNEVGNSIKTVIFSANKWYDFIIEIRINKKSIGTVKLYDSKKEKIASWSGSIGYFGESGAKPFYRLKYGIYKSAEPGKRYHVNFRKVRIFEDKGKAFQYLLDANYQDVAYQ